MIHLEASDINQYVIFDVLNVSQIEKVKVVVFLTYLIY